MAELVWGAAVSDSFDGPASAPLSTAFRVISAGAVQEQLSEFARALARGEIAASG